MREALRRLCVTDYSTTAAQLHDIQATVVAKKGKKSDAVDGSTASSLLRVGLPLNMKTFKFTYE